jgi:hypothetical protein
MEEHHKGLRDDLPANTLSYVQVSYIKRAALMRIVEAFPKAKAILEKAARRLTLRAAVWKHYRAVIKRAHPERQSLGSTAVYLAKLHAGAERAPPPPEPTLNEELQPVLDQIATLDRKLEQLSGVDRRLVGVDRKLEQLLSLRHDGGAQMALLLEEHTLCVNPCLCPNGHSGGVFAAAQLSDPTAAGTMGGVQGAIATPASQALTPASQALTPASSPPKSLLGCASLVRAVASPTKLHKQKAKPSRAGRSPTRPAATAAAASPSPDGSGWRPLPPEGAPLTQEDLSC